jgi:hypothetical protein
VFQAVNNYLSPQMNADEHGCLFVPAKNAKNANFLRPFGFAGT